MKGQKYVFFLLVAMISFQVYAVAGNNPSSMKKPVGANQEIVEKISRLEKNTTSFNCNFESQLFIEDQAEPKKEEGTIAFKAPSLWRLEKYEPGAKTPFFMAGCNGKTIWNTDKEGKDPNAITKTNVESLSADERNALMFQTTGISPFFLFGKGLIANVSSATDGQDNTWVVEVVPDESISSTYPFKVDKIKFEISKETGLIKFGELFNKGKRLASVKFKIK